jgi:hypothetical protein
MGFVCRAGRRGRPRRGGGALGACLAAVVLAAGLAACGGSNPRGTGSPPPSASPSPPASPTPTFSPAIGCTTVTPDQVNAALGTTVGVPDVSHPSPEETDCTYTGPSQLVTVDIVVGENAAGFQADRQQLTAGCGTSANSNCLSWSTVAGVGDQAYELTESSPDGTTTILLALKGSNSFLISSQTSLDTLKTLMAQVLAQAGPG